MKFTSAAFALIGAVSAFPNMAKLMNVDSASLEKRFASNLAAMSHLEKRAYKGQTGAYGYVAPGKGDFRGPCPGLNTAANHGYLPHNGIATFAQFVQAQMDLYGVGLDLAVLLCTVAIPLDGDIITTKMSIGGDATSQTAALGAAQAPYAKEGGLIVHNTFEADTSLTRDDVYLANGNNYDFNGTLFKMMTDTCQQTSGGLYDRKCMSLYRKQRYDQSRATNPNFYFGIKSLLLFGASSFLYELMPTAGGQPDFATISAFFGAESDGKGSYKNHLAGVNEHIPPNWFPRTTPYSIPLVAEEIGAQYFAYPVEFGGNAGVGNFNGQSYGQQVANGKLSASNAQDLQCLLFQFATDNVPSVLGGTIALTSAAFNWANLKISPYRTTSGCPAVTGQPVLSA